MEKSCLYISSYDSLFAGQCPDQGSCKDLRTGLFCIEQTPPCWDIPLAQIRSCCYNAIMYAAHSRMGCRDSSCSLGTFPARTLRYRALSRCLPVHGLLKLSVTPGSLEPTGEDAAINNVTNRVKNSPLGGISDFHVAQFTIPHSSSYSGTQWWDELHYEVWKTETSSGAPCFKIDIADNNKNKIHR